MGLETDLGGAGPPGYHLVLSHLRCKDLTPMPCEDVETWVHWLRVSAAMQQALSIFGSDLPSDIPAGCSEYCQVVLLLIYSKTGNFHLEEIFAVAPKNRKFSIPQTFFPSIRPTLPCVKNPQHFLLRKAQNRKTAKFYGCQYFIF